MTLEEALMNPLMRFKINHQYYKMVEEAPIEGDVVLDIRNGTHGIHDGQIGDFISVRDYGYVEGCPVDKIKKLVVTDDIKD